MPSHWRNGREREINAKPLIQLQRWKHFIIELHWGRQRPFNKQIHAFISDFLISFPCCQFNKNPKRLLWHFACNEFMHFITYYHHHLCRSSQSAHTDTQTYIHGQRQRINFHRTKDERVIKIMNKQSGILKKPTLLECCTDWIKLILSGAHCVKHTKTHCEAKENTSQKKQRRSTERKRATDINCTYWILCANKIL